LNSRWISLLAILGLILAGMACDFSTMAPIVPTMTPYPTYTPYPQPTPYPTYTPVAAAEAGINQWVLGHYWSIRVTNAETRTSLDGNNPSQNIFVLVDVEWKAVDPTLKRRISGADFQLVDVNDTRYDISGMIYDPTTFEPFGANAMYQPNKWVIADIVNDNPDTYRLVFDLPRGKLGLSLWFQDLPKIDLKLSLP
jgi:hypothetical protein